MRNLRLEYTFLQNYSAGILNVKAMVYVQSNCFIYTTNSLTHLTQLRRPLPYRIEHAKCNSYSSGLSYSLSDVGLE